MPIKESEILSIKRMKKDGDLGDDYVDRVVSSLRNGAIIVLPIDNIFCLAGLSPATVKKTAEKLSGRKVSVIGLVSSYKMLNDLAVYSKSDYDFMNRIWPGEINVILKKPGTRNSKKTIIRFPKNRFILNVVDRLEMPLYYSDDSSHFRKRDIVSAYKYDVDLILVIDELCKKHPSPSIVDISENSLNIINAGKVSSEEIKSLYFLGKADD